ncbi:MjaI family restriction endonuclease [Halorhabdus sp. BNX81]|uniref:MjaI family restriction endonuclease n=1 Tax=Halorhabdus sp. BNX81 TaxID=2980181 RepID=UPI0023DD66B1|nr:MjaI family restriction endonuclease [Halorhabdus sp. BNX81]
MAETITITPDERKQLTTGDPKKAPKYTFFALNNAVKYSSANQRPTVGKITEIYEEFEQEHPNGDFQDWRNYYYNQYNGRQRIDDATDKAYNMFLTIRAAIDDIDREDIRDFIEGLVLNGTYSNQNAREAVIQKLLESRSETERLSPDEGPDGCELQWGDRYVSIQPEEIRSETLFDREDVIVFYFSENASDNGLKIDVSKSNMTLDEF